MSDTFFKIFIFIHIVGGTLGLISGILIFSLPKGTQRHKILGKLFIAGMLTAGISSQVLAYIHPNSFLFMVGIFTIYMVGTGARSIATKDPASRSAIDRFLQAGMVLSGLALAYLGIEGLLGGNSFGIVYVVFAGIGLIMVSADLRPAKKIPKDKNAYLRKHFQRLGGGFIASMTAFLVVNIRELPEWLPLWTLWLLPTVLISPLLVQWSNKYKPVSGKPST
jgi:uncharacterized membrane protein